MSRQSAERRAQSAERRAQSAEHRAQSAEHRAQSTERRAQGACWAWLALRTLAFAIGLLLFLASAVDMARAQYVSPYVIVQGTLTTAGGTPAQNATLNFAPSQVFFVSGTSVVVTSAQCSTDTSGAVVGVANPVSGPRVSAQYVGTLPAGNYYVRFTWYDQFGNQTLPSVEVAQQLTAAGELQILPPVGSGPPTATGMDVYIGAAPGAETYQGQTTGTTAQFTQATAITTTGAAVPIRNSTACRVVANDAGWPTGTGYQVSLTDASGNTLFNYSQLWQFLGPGSTYNLSSGIPYYNGQVTYPVPVLTQPYNHNLQSISGPLSMGQPGGVGYNIVNVNELGVGTSLPAWGVDVEGSGLAGEINALGGYLVNGGAGTAGQCLTSNGTVFNTPANCFDGTLYYQTLESGGTGAPQEPTFNFIGAGSVSITAVDNAGDNRTDVTITGANTAAQAVTLAPYTGTGSGATAVCAGGATCDSNGGTVLLTTGTGATALAFTVTTTPALTKAFRCAATVTLPSPELAIVFGTTTVATVEGTTSPSSSTSYTITYVCN